MRFVVVSSPGPGPHSHWSHAAAAAVGELLVAARHDVLWFAPMRTEVSLPPLPAGVELRGTTACKLRRLDQVDTDNSDLELETLLAHSLREHPADAVVHVGAGARGSPNVAWLAERMGSPAFVVTRASELVCHRGDLVDRDGQPCDRFLEPERCRRCCATSWLQQPGKVAFQNRSDLLVASLMAAEAVFLATPAERAPLLAFGVPEALLVVGSEPARIVARVTARG